MSNNPIGMGSIIVGVLGAAAIGGVLILSKDTSKSEIQSDDQNNSTYRGGKTKRKKKQNKTKVNLGKYLNFIK